MGSQMKNALLALGMRPAGGKVSRSAEVSEKEFLPKANGAMPMAVRYELPAPKNRSRSRARTVSASPSQPAAFVAQSKIVRTAPSPTKGPISAEKPSVPQGPKPIVVIKPVTRLIRTGEFHPHPLFSDDDAGSDALTIIEHDGISNQLTQHPEDATDLIVGLDFGTSSTKVVIRDVYATNGVYPVPLIGQRGNVSSFLLPSRVYKNQGIYSLDRSGTVHGDLKLSLLNCKAQLPITEFNDCCGFLALVIRRSRGWLFSALEHVYRNHELTWRFNIGVAARSYEQRNTVDLFRRLAWAAANLAADSTAVEISETAADLWRQRSMAALAGAAFDPNTLPSFNLESVDVVPEVSAQLQGFMSSARWNWKERPVMMLVDIGAGTVDVAVFHVKVHEGTPNALIFYACRVEPNGVMNLNDYRLEWLAALLHDGAENSDALHFMASLKNRTDRIRPIPERVDDYLGGYKLDLVGASADDTFLTERYRREVAGTINDSRLIKGVALTQLQHMPLLLCGGGSRMPFYRDIGEAINKTKEWHVSVDVMRPPVPLELTENGWHQEEFDRISVAYGLSLAGSNGYSLGSIVRATDIPDEPRHKSINVEDRYVTKDQM